MYLLGVRLGACELWCPRHAMCCLDPGSPISRTKGVLLCRQSGSQCGVVMCGLSHFRMTAGLSHGSGFFHGHMLHVEYCWSSGVETTSCCMSVRAGVYAAWGLLGCFESIWTHSSNQKVHEQASMGAMQHKHHAQHSV